MIRVLCVGKIKEKALASLIDDYTKKIGRYHKIEIVEVRDEAIRDDEADVLDKEGKRLLEKIGKDDYVILLDLHGKSIDSLSLSDKIEKLFISHSRITFVIGGSLGLSDELRKRADEAIRLSDLTFLHGMTRLILLEQIYRCFKISRHETYHK